MSHPVLTLFDTLQNRPVPFEPREPGKVSLYVCGPTVYDAAHLGHARCYIVWDVLVRFLRFIGYQVTYVRNVTDVDDKILKRADASGNTPEQVAAENYASFAADMAALNVLKPDKEPRATQFIAQMITAIEALVTKNAAYVTPGGTVYYRVSAKKDYGKLSKKPLDELKSGARVEVDPHKENPLDFALWKHVSPEEQQKPGHAFDSPWGKGRPGWHIECSAMNFAELGPQIDIHAGGADLIFPHHENEIAQSEAWLDLPGDAPNRSFAKYWLHNGFVNVSGEKMSKSLGNFSTIQKVLARYDANTIRYFLLTNGYRMPVDFNDEALEGKKKAIQRIQKQLRNTCAYFELSDAQLPAWLEEQQVRHPDMVDLFTQAMLEDLNTAKALALLSTAVTSAAAVLNAHGVESAEEKECRKDLFLALLIFHHLGFNLAAIFEEPPLELPAGQINQAYHEVMGQPASGDLHHQLGVLLTSRKEAKAAKDWAQADVIRNHMTALGLSVLDNKDGTTSLEKDGQEIVRV